MISVRNQPQSPTAWPKDWVEHPSWRFLRNLYVKHYGGERALAITDGRDAATNADLAAWGRVGHE